MSERCCLRECDAEGRASLRFEILRSPDVPAVVEWAHDTCFSLRADPSVEPDDPKDHGGIPGGARCVFCARRLPIIGKHPLMLLVGTDSPPLRFWVHAECAPEHFDSSALQRLGFAG